MAINQTWSGIRGNISVNSAHELGDRTLYQNRHCKRSPMRRCGCDLTQGWKLQRVKPTRDPILRVDCVVEGEQTSFEDERYE
ncbi:MAG: hypothetical protein LVS60_18540 [Nodosilinea sp. LVE1205-7]